MKYRILFVDDEPLVLQGLQRMLRALRQEWEMEFVNSGARALEQLAHGRFDAVVTDMRMPGMNGAELLNEVMRRHPQTVRLVLSGQADENLILKCVGVTHQYLAKPCDLDALRSAVHRAVTAGASLNNPSLKAIVCKLDCLPSIPSLYSQLIKVLEDPKVNLEEVAAIITRDIAMTAKILKLVNSTYFGLSRGLTDVGEALAYLGINTLKTLVLTIHAFSQFEGERRAREFCPDRLWAHSLEVAATARQVAQQENAPTLLVEQAFVAGMLHDIGQLIFAINLPSQYDQVLQTARSDRIPLHRAEAAAFGATHAELGGYLLGLWGLPALIVEAIALHHAPRLAAGTAFSALTAVHIAEAFHPHESAPPADPSEPAPDTTPDMGYLEALGLADRLSLWKNAALESGLPPL